jgi:NTP pyrophosphatase (non-canonical NTP hydrolase)
MAPGLTPAQIERLALLVEEAAELGQIGGKTLRHGLDSTWGGLRPRNSDAVAAEFGDVLAAFALLVAAGDVESESAAIQAAERKLERIGEFLHHQPGHLLAKAREILRLWGERSW